ncbi:MAG: hypothetical protein NW208_17340 [Bryobacter sp.]|nr:hypothetical protein [Bryobacter sp.]
MLLCVALALASGAEIIPVSITASTTQPGMEAVSLINGSGLAGNLHGNQPSDMWLSDNFNPGSDMPFGILTFSLLGPETLRSFEIWNYNEDDALAQGVSFFELRYTAGGASLSAGWFNLAIGTGGAGAAQVFVLPSEIVAESLTLNLVANHGDPNYLGLSEIKFYSNALNTNTTPTVGEEDPPTNTDLPEPSSALFVLAGGAALAALRRSR